jgi:uncharacterized membrane protein
LHAGPVPACHPPWPALRALIWCREGLRLWRRAPIKLTLMALFPLMLEGALQLIPVAGVLLSKPTVAVVWTGLYLVVDDLAHGRPARWRRFLEVRRSLWPLILVSLAFLVVLASQVAVATAVYGPHALGVLVGHRYPELRGKGFVLTLILPGLILATLLGLAAPLVVLDGLPAGRALVTSARKVLAAAAPCTVYVLIQAALLTSSLFLAGVPMILFVPWLCTSGYAAYRDLSRR